MSRPRTRSRKPASRPSSGWRAALAERLTLPGPGRLAGLGALVAVAVAALVMLVSVSAGGLNRFGLQRLAADAPQTQPAKPGYLRR